MKPKIVCFWILFAFALGLLWYNHQYHCYGYPFLTTPSGLSYKAIGRKSSSAKKVQDGQWVEVSILMKPVDKKGQAEKVIINRPEFFPVRFDKSFQEGNKLIAEMIRMVQPNQRMVFKCRVGYFLETINLKDPELFLKAYNLTKEDELVTDIKLDKIMTDEERKEMLQARYDRQLEQDKAIIRDYLAKHHIAASSTDSGLSYIIDQSSDGTPVLNNHIIHINYTGKLLDGTIFETSVEEVAKANKLYDPKQEYKPLKFQVGFRNVIQGWDEGFLLLKKGEKARFFIPSGLAYGEYSFLSTIPKNSILLFEVEVVDVCDPDKADANDTDSNKSNNSKSNDSKSDVH